MPTKVFSLGFEAIKGWWLSNLGAFAPKPNCRFNADANISHAFGIFMAYVGALQPAASGAG